MKKDDELPYPYNLEKDCMLGTMIMSILCIFSSLSSVYSCYKTEEKEEAKKKAEDKIKNTG